MCILEVYLLLKGPTISTVVRYCIYLVSERLQPLLFTCDVILVDGEMPRAVGEATKSAAKRLAFIISF